MSCDCKECLKCGELKPLDQFSKDSSKKDGKNIYCISCRKLMSAEWKQKSGYNEKRLTESKYNQYKKVSTKFSRIIDSHIAQFDFLKECFDLYFFILVCALKNNIDMLLKRRARHKKYDKEKRPKQSRQLSAPNEVLRRARKKSAILPSTDNLIIGQIVNNRVALDSYAKAEGYLANKLDLANKLPSSQKTRWSTDHLIPLSKGGSHHQDNLEISKLSKNIAKLDHSYEQYIHVQTRWAMNKESFENPLSPYFKNNS
jgi:5-methylcytosine-specific restriction endonuclease McrA